MGRTIAIANQKGGVGKSTTAINLSACLAEKGKKVLTIDMDPQGNTTSGLGVDKNAVEDTLYELLVGQSDVDKTIVKDVIENVDLIPIARTPDAIKDITVTSSETSKVISSGDTFSLSPLAVGETVVTFIVRTVNGTEKTYTVSVYRLKLRYLKLQVWN